MAELQTIDPTRTALLLMDFMPSIVARVPEPEGLLERVFRAQAAARDNGIHVAYVRVALTDEEATAVPDANLRFSQAAASGRMREGTPEADIDPRLEPADEEPVVRKRRVGALSTTDLDADLRRRGIDTLALAGIATSGVVLSTVRDAADRDYRLIVIEDCCFDSDDEVHRVLTEKVFPSQAAVMSVERFERLASGDI